MRQSFWRPVKLIRDLPVLYGLNCADDALIPPGVFEFDNQSGINIFAQPLTPFDYGDPIPTHKILQSDRPQSQLTRQAIKIYMINRTASLVNIDNREGRAVNHGTILNA